MSPWSNAPAESRALAARSPRALLGGLPRALALLTVVPLPAGARTSLAGAAGWLALVGAAVGALAGGIRVGAAQLLGRGPATALAMVALVAVTGALHQDGLADSADGLGARGDRRRRLQVLRDPAIGSYGALALIGWALLLFATLDSLDDARSLAALIAAGALGRWAALLHAVSTPAARGDGLGAALQAGPLALAAGTLTALAAAVLMCGAPEAAAALGAALLCALALGGLARRFFGGRTGDTLGAIVAVTEVAVCTALLAAWHG